MGIDYQLESSIHFTQEIQQEMIGSTISPQAPKEEYSARELKIEKLYKATTPNPFFIEAQKVQQILADCDYQMDELLQDLVCIAQLYSIAPISNFHVGGAGLGKSGNLYLGVNIEFAGQPLNQAVHCEQFLLANARSHGETGLETLAISATPCGHCRQFLNEIAGDNDIRFLVPNSTDLTLSSLLPHAFGPKDLGVQYGVLAQPEPYHSTNPCELTAKAIEVAYSSYAPYSNAKSGVAIKTKDGSIFTGAYMENAAFNPTLSPFQAAIVTLTAHQQNYSHIDEVVLVELKNAVVSQRAVSEDILKSIAPHVTLQTVIIDNF